MRRRRASLIQVAAVHAPHFAAGAQPTMVVQDPHLNPSGSSAGSSNDRLDGARLLTESLGGCFSSLVAFALALGLSALIVPLVLQFRQLREDLERLASIEPATVERSWWRIETELAALSVGTNWRGFSSAERCVRFVGGGGSCVRIAPLGEYTLTASMETGSLPWVDARGLPEVPVFFDAEMVDWLESQPAPFYELPGGRTEATRLEAFEHALDQPLARLHTAWSRSLVQPTAFDPEVPGDRLLLHDRDRLLADLDRVPKLLVPGLLGLPLLVCLVAARSLPLPGVMRLAAGLGLAMLCGAVAPSAVHLPGPIGRALESFGGLVQGQIVGVAELRLGDRAALAPESDSDLRPASWTVGSTQDADLMQSYDLLRPPEQPPADEIALLLELADRIERRWMRSDDEDLLAAFALLTERLREERTSLELAFVPGTRTVFDDVRRSERVREAALSYLDEVRGRYAQVIDDAYHRPRLLAVFENDL